MKTTERRCGRLTTQAVSSTAELVQRACKPLTIGLSHLTNFGSPFLNSSKALACSSNMTKTSSGDLQQSTMAVSGWSARPFPVLLVYLVMAASNSALKLEAGEVVSTDKGIGIRVGSMSLRARERGKLLR